MFDVAIIGAGPAGIAAAIYASRFRLKTLLISPDIGGWSAKAHRIENLPSYLSILGKELKARYTEHVRANDIEFVTDRVKRIEKKPGNFVISTNTKHFESAYCIYALGTKKRKLNVPGEDGFLGKGVCLCATCDAPFFKGRKVAVIGGNDSGTTSALLIAEYADHVTIIEVLKKLPSEPVWVEKVEAHPKIDVITGDTVKAIKGSGVVRSIVLGSGKELEVDGVFIEIGSVPETELAKEVGAELDQWGCIKVDRCQQTNVDRLYAAGDATDGLNYMRQIVAAQAEGAVAAQAIYKRRMKGE